ncbi:MAG: response regulator transcription factor [Limnohabitans sp.]|nr:response regulator transcription factor [Limnohabitans sp.]
MNSSMGRGHIDLVEDNAFLRESLSRVLLNEGYTVNTWADAHQFLDHMSETVPAVVVTDMRMPELSGVQMHAELLKRGRLRPVIYISGESTVQQTIDAMKLGAADFLVKPFSVDELLQAVAAGMDKDAQKMKSLTAQARAQEAMRALTNREREVFQLLLKGMSNAEIMDAMGISLPTAKQYKSSVMQKLGVRTLSQLMELGVSN